MAQNTPQQYNLLTPQATGYPTIPLQSISQPQYVLVPRPEATPYANGLFGGFGGPLTPTLTNIALGNTAHSVHSQFGLPNGAYPGAANGAYPNLLPYGGLDGAGE